MKKILLLIFVLLLILVKASYSSEKQPNDFKVISIK
jgi:hypothetical protein